MLKAINKNLVLERKSDADIESIKSDIQSLEKQLSECVVGNDPDKVLEIVSELRKKDALLEKYNRIKVVNSGAIEIRNLDS